MGATFAYFTATTTPSGNVGEAANIKTAQVADISFTKESIEPTSNIVYPGTKNAVGAGFTTKVNGDVDNKYTISYTVSGNVTLKDSENSLESSFKHPVKWRLYELDEKIADQLVTCTNNPKVETDPENPNETHYTAECEEHAKLLEDKVVADGVINEEGECQASGEGKGKNQVACGTKAEFTYDGTITASKTDAKKYYYLVVEYPNIEGSQNDDMNKNISFAISDISVTGTKDNSQGN